MSASPPTAGRMRSVWIYVAVVSILGAILIATALLELRQVAFTPWILVLAVVTIVSGRYRIKVPGHPASVSVSEVFVFASILLFGAAPTTLIVAADGLLISLTQKNKKIYRALFNISEPAISTFGAARAFAATQALSIGWLGTSGSGHLILPTVAMAATYFVSNSVLTSLAVALESGRPVGANWKQQALYLAINDYAAASIAVLMFETHAGLNVIGLIAPLLALSYAAYQSAARRVEDADKHLREVEGLYQATVETLAIAVDAKDQVTHGHIRRVQRHTLAVAKAMGVVDPLELRALEAASLLHDVGKLAVPDYVLNKPGALSHEEFERMKQHAAKGAEILDAVEFPYAVVPVVRHHHEQWNGRGYPDGLAGEAIPFGARVLSVVDCFDAVTSDRPYRRKMSDEQGIEVLRARRGTMYDPRIVDVFISLIPQLRNEDRMIELTSPHETPATTEGDVATIAEGPADVFIAETTLPTAAALTEQLRQMVPGAEACFFAPADDSGQLRVACGTRAMSPDVFALRIPTGEGLAGWVAVNRHTIVNSHADLDLGALARDLGVEACTAAPVFALGNLVGVLSVYLPAGRKFSESDVRAVGALSQMLGLTIASSAGTLPPELLAHAALESGRRHAQQRGCA
jgi:putative nucleotidyltransferase with HDIG domain